MPTADAQLERVAAAYKVAATEATTASQRAAEQACGLAGEDRASTPTLSRAVLVVDDNGAARWAIVEAIRSACHVVVHEAATTAAADLMLARHHPAVIVCDWNLRVLGRPAESGLRWLLSAPRCYRACLVSGHDVLTTLDRECRTVGVRAFVRPITPAATAELTSHVRALLDEAAPVAPVAP